MKNENVYLVAKKLADEWADKAEDNIREKVTSTLDGRLTELVLLAAGFEQSYQYTGGGYAWKVDHCNGRAGNSPIGHLIAEAVRDRLRDLAGTVTLTKEEEQQIRDAYREEYLRKYKAAVIQSAQRDAQKHAEEYTKNTIKSALDGAAEVIRLQLMEKS